MVQPFRVVDADDPGRDRGGWDESGNIDLPGILTVNRIRGAGSSTPALSTITFESMITFLAAVGFTATILNLVGATAAADVLTTAVTGDAAPRHVVDADGTHRWSDGTGAPDVNLYRPSGGTLKTDNFFNAGSMQSDGDVSMYGTNFTLGTVGGGLRVKEGTNARMGRATLVAGTVVVATTAVTAGSEIFLMCQTPGGTPGFLRVSARAAATSFTILSSSGTDTSVVGWVIFEPAP